PENHLLYGNRALCFLRTEHYIKALWDGKRSIVLKPNWPKGHYRFCDALSVMGKLKEALEANLRGQELCENNPKGIKDLIQQREKLIMQLEETGESDQESKQSDNEKKKSDSQHNVCQQMQTKVLELVVAGQLQALLDGTDYVDPFQFGFRPGYGTESALVALYDDLCRERDRGSASLLVLLDVSAAFDTIDHGEVVAVLNRCLAEVMGWMRANKLSLNPDKTEVLLVGGAGLQVADNTQTKENKDWLSDFTSGLNENQRKPRSKMGDSEKMRDQLNPKTDSQKGLDKQNTTSSTMEQVDISPSLEMLMTCIKNGYTALMDQRFHSAEQSFELLLNTLDKSQLQPPNILQQMNLAVVDYVVILYGYATALLGIGQLEALTKAKEYFNNIIEQYQKVRFDCLAHYGIGKVYMRQNRFSEALDQFMKSKIMVRHKMVPGVLTWPTTSVVIEETRPERLQVILEDCIEECKFPPNPDAICRYQQCQAHKIKIYFSDPDFKGFIRVACCEQCIVEFHVTCWKKLKATRYSDKNDKDILRELCFTPDCKGLISKIVVYSSCGLVKCEFEHKIKNKNPPKPTVKQKCLRNLQIKQERKCLKEAISATVTDHAEVSHKENCISKDNNHKGSIQKSYFTGDTVLQLIVQRAANIQAGVHDTFKLLNELFSWWVLSEEDYAQISSSCLLPIEVVDQIINFLITKNDRVKSRIFVHILSELEEVDPNLHDWMKHLDNNGLKATKIFFAEHGTCFVNLDLSLIAVLWNEKYGFKLGRMFSFTSEDTFDILDYFRELSYMEIRCFLWMLEENRENFPFLHQFLDDYFDNLDNPFTVITKEGTETTLNNTIKVKKRNQKKAKGS
ncbi:E3 ubiquitin-protein ligase TTC3, partial [Varanus komodoensis]